MSDKAANVKKIDRFLGYGTNRDPHDNPELAIDVANVTFHEPGKMPCRKGNYPLSFSNDTGTAANLNVVSAFPYKRAGISYIVHEDSSGNVRVGRL